MTAANTNSLQAVQAMLDERGVRDVKFFFGESRLGLSECKVAVAGVLRSYMNGSHTESPEFGDSKK